ncbi:MAG: hypothetical protein HQK53_13240 [Oligoflexia bacterium]|nr:hypothetical protein [Oligoflexia bacterium]
MQKSKDFNKLNILYSSALSDFGNIECHNDRGQIYFIQNQSGQNGKNNKSDKTSNVITGHQVITKTELVSLNISDKKITTLSDLNNVTQVLDIDGKIIVPFQGDFYIAYGDNTTGKDNLPSK